MTEHHKQTALAVLAQRFERFGSVEARHSSPLYARLALGVAADRELLDLAACAPAGQPVPNLLLAAVHFLLLQGVQDPVAAYYPSISGRATLLAGDPYPAFRACCLTHRTEIDLLLRTRLVQTNEVGRCACLLPAFRLVAELADGRPLALVELGASAGLNLCWDRYGYDYGDGRRYGDVDAPVQLACQVRGEPGLPLLAAWPHVASRIGLDLQPVDAGDPAQVLWLRALICPEHAERATRLSRAVELARREPPSLLAGDALHLLPSVLSAIPTETPVCVFHSFMANQLAQTDRARLWSVLAARGEAHPVYRVWMEGTAGAHAELGLATYAGGTQGLRTLAACEPHGRWIAWQDSVSARL